MREIRHLINKTKKCSQIQQHTQLYYRITRSLASITFNHHLGHLASENQILSRGSITYTRFTLYTVDMPWFNHGFRGKNLFWSIKNSGEVFNKLKSRGFRATSLSTYDFSTLYTTLPHNLIKEKLINLIDWTWKVHLILPVKKDRLSSLLKTQNDINFGLAKTSVKP